MVTTVSRIMTRAYRGERPLFNMPYVEAAIDPEEFDTETLLVQMARKSTKVTPFRKNHRMGRLICL